MLFGRDAETRTLHRLLDEAQAQRGGATVLRGEAGVGKSALLAAATEEATAREMLVLGTAGVQAEIHVPYAGLHRLLHPVREAGAGVLDVLRAPDAEPYRVALALLEFLGAAGRVVLVSVEDGHWLDAPSWEVLAFVARRLESDPVLLLTTARDGAETARRLAVAALPELLIEPLPPEPSGVLLDSVAPDLPPAVRDRVLDESAGNPLGIVELGAVAARSGAAALLPSWLPLSTRVERTFAGLVAELPRPTRTLLFVAAIDDGDAIDEMLAACAHTEEKPVTLDDVEPAVSARLVRVDDQFRLRFRHPLLRSALYQAATPAQRRRVHAALAQVLAGQADRVVWHRAAASPGPDEALARELTEFARRAGRLQAASTQLAALERAVQLSEDPQERASRTLHAAEAASEQGDVATVIRLLGEVDAEQLRPAEQARNSWVRESVLKTGWSGTTKLANYARIIDTMRRDGDHDLAVDSLLGISIRVFWSNPDDETRQLFLDAADRIDVPRLDPRLVAGLTMVAPPRRWPDLLDRLEQLQHRLDMNPFELAALGQAANGIGAFDLSALFLAAATAGLRAQGRIGVLGQALMAHAFNAVYLGDARLGRLAAAEAAQLAREAGQPLWVVSAEIARGHAEALRGNSAQATELADYAEGVLAPLGAHPMLAMVQHVRGVDALAAGRPEDAFRQFYRIFDPADVAYHPAMRLHSFGHLTEAAARGGRHAELAALVAELEPLAVLSRSPVLAVTLPHARAVLAGDHEAGALFEAALAGDLSPWPFERSRLQLAYGSWLRRQRRPAGCRPLLRAAATTFDALDAGPWAERARQELRASGESLRAPVDAVGRLTPQELQIAQLAADGLSNRDIAERLFLSPRTVTTHLYRIYPKLGISSRAELAGALQVT